MCWQLVLYLTALTVSATLFKSFRPVLFGTAEHISLVKHSHTYVSVLNVVVLVSSQEVYQIWG